MPRCFVDWERSWRILKLGPDIHAVFFCCSGKDNLLFTGGLFTWEFNFKGILAIGYRDHLGWAT